MNHPSAAGLAAALHGHDLLEAPHAP